MLLTLCALSACLPHGAVGGGGRADAQAWTFTLEEVPSTRCEGRLSLHYAEAFRDGSVGWLVCMDGGGGAVVADDCVELRAFPSGEVLEVRGLAGTPGLALHDLLWPVLSPALGRDDGNLSWPLYAGPRDTRRTVANGRWTGGPSAWNLEATLDDNDPELTSSGEFSAALVLSRGRLASASWRARRDACAGAECVERDVAGRIEAIAPVASLPAEAVAARVQALAARQPGATTAASYVGLLRDGGRSVPGRCPGTTPAEGKLVESAKETTP